MIVPAAKQVARAASAALALSFTALTFTPLRIYAGNSLEFDFPLGRAALVALAAGALATLLLFLLLASLPRRLNEKGVALTIMLAVLAWIQGNILVWSYGALDGRDIPWRKFLVPGMVDVAVWAALLAVAWTASAFLTRRAALIALLLLAIQSAATGLDLLRLPPQTSRQKYEFDYSGQFVFSSGTNVLLLLPDAFQGNVFQELIAAEPQWRESFPGFVHFPNALAGYTGTLFSVPYILTGRMYDDTPTSEFARRAFKESLPGVLLKNGFRSEFYPLMFDLIDYHPGLASNLLPKSSIRLADYALLFDVALFRSLPQPGKRLVYNDQLWFLQRLFPESRGRPADRVERRAWKARMRKARHEVYSLYDKGLADAMERQARVGGAAPVFKYFHLRGLHLPLFMNRQCHFQRLPPTRQNYLNQARCCLDGIRRILETLKRIGVYERTMIVIVGDHGVGAPEVEFRSDLYPTPQPPAEADRRLARLKAAAMPLFLVKPLGAGRGDPLRQSLAPVTLGDIPRSVAEALQIKADFPGESVFSLDESRRRLRRFFAGMIAVDTRQKRGESFAYQVDGPAWLDSSWRLVAVNRVGRNSRMDQPPAVDEALLNEEEEP